VHRAASVTGALIAAVATGEDDEDDEMKFDIGEDEYELYDVDKSAQPKTAKPKINKSNSFKPEDKTVPKHEDYPPIKI